MFSFGDVGFGKENYGENGDESEGICEENWPIDRVRIDCVMAFTLNEHRSARSQCQWLNMVLHE